MKQFRQKYLNRVKLFSSLSLAMVMFFFISCSKELENERSITGEWKVEEVLFNNFDVTAKNSDLGIIKYSFTFRLKDDAGFVFTSGGTLLGADWKFVNNETAINFTGIKIAMEENKRRKTGFYIPCFVDKDEFLFAEGEDSTFNDKEVWTVEFGKSKTMVLSHTYAGNKYEVKMVRTKNFSIDRKD